MWKANSAELWWDVLLCMVYMQAAHLWVFQLTKTCSREFYRRKESVLRTSKQSGQMSVLESTALPLLSLSLLPFFSCSLVSSLSLSASQDYGVPSPLFSGEIRLTCRRLKGICSAHQVCVVMLFPWTAPPENVKQRENHMWDLFRCGHSAC